MREDLRNLTTEAVRGTCLKFYGDSDLYTEDMMQYVLYSEKGMPVRQIMKLAETANSMMVKVRLKGILESEGTLEPLEKVDEDVPQFLVKLLTCEISPVDFFSKHCHILNL